MNFIVFLQYLRVKVLLRDEVASTAAAQAWYPHSEQPHLFLPVRTGAQGSVGQTGKEQDKKRKGGIEASSYGKSGWEKETEGFEKQRGSGTRECRLYTNYLTQEPLTACGYLDVNVNQLKWNEITESTNHILST